MARKPRLLVDGGAYHIISRGHNRYRLFHSPSDYEKYRKLVAQYRKKFVFELFHFCLMPNHAHLLLKILRGEEVPYLMQGVNQSYANHCKRRYGLVGNLFQGRYQCLYVNKDEYLLECARYIERNPLRAGIVKDIPEYRWSSYNFYAKGKADNLVTPDPLYLALSGDARERMELYTEYVLQERAYEHALDRELKI